MEVKPLEEIETFKYKLGLLCFSTSKSVRRNPRKAVITQWKGNSEIRALFR